MVSQVECHFSNASLATKSARQSVLSTNKLTSQEQCMATNKSEKKTKQKAGSPKPQELGKASS